MNVAELLADLPVTPVSLQELFQESGLPHAPLTEEQYTVVVTGISVDSRRIRPGDLYMALPGAQTHGIQYLEQAIQQGAVVVITDAAGAADAALQVTDSSVPIISVSEPRQWVGALAGRIYQRDPMQLFAVTGTNGKTTVSYLVRSLLLSLGKPSGLMGTVATMIGETEIPSTFTTPEATEVHGILAGMAERQVKTAVLEVSSHALSYHRVAGVSFEVSGFTNLSQDHLDLHHSMEEYAATKAKLFTPEYTQRAVVMIDDAWGQWMAEQASVPVWTISTDATREGADWLVTSAEPAGQGWQLSLRHTQGAELHFRTSLPGNFNIANAALAVLMVHASGVPLEELQTALDTANPLSITVPGRMEVISAQPKAIVDFAHNPEGLAKVLASLRESRGSGRLIAVMGATGERDRSKRPIMGAITARDADVVIITDDDPHDEDPEQIRQEVYQGAQEVIAAEGLSTQVEMVAPRAAAIIRAVEIATAEDTVLIAGRGHELWQEVRGVNYALDDRQELAQALQRRGFKLLPSVTV